jgi:transcriptional regulator with XRE-family HTH domain
MVKRLKMHPVKQYRELHDLTLSELADLVDTSDATISRIERGLQNPSLALLQRFVDRTGLKAEDFLRQEAAE